MGTAQAAAGQEVSDGHTGIRLSSLRSPEALLVQQLGNLNGRPPRTAELNNALLERFIVVELLIFRYGTENLVLADEAALPVDRHIDDFRLPLGLDDHSFNEMPDDRFPISGRGR